MNTNDMRQFAERKKQEILSQTNEFANATFNSVIEFIKERPFNRSVYFPYIFYRYESVPEAIRKDVAEKVFKILINNGYEISFNHSFHTKGSWNPFNFTDDILNSFTLSW